MFWASMLWSKTVGAIKNGLQYERRNSFYTADWRFRELLPILECWIFKMNDEKHFIAIFAVRVETFLMNSLLDGEFVIFHLEDVCVRLLNVCVFILKICFKKLNVFSVRRVVNILKPLVWNDTSMKSSVWWYEMNTISTCHYILRLKQHFWWYLMYRSVRLRDESNRDSVCSFYLLRNSAFSTLSLNYKQLSQSGVTLN